MDTQNISVQKDKFSKTNEGEPGAGTCGLLFPTVPTTTINKPTKNRNPPEDLYKKNPRSERRELLGKA